MTGADGINRRVTGVVLGGGVVMGPSELSKLPVSPAIFFVNCCNLGKIDATAEDKARQESLEGRPELAASVAVAIDPARRALRHRRGLGGRRRLRQGVRPALLFGDARRRELRRGDAAARKAAYETKPNNNTWGAFQCYGDPDYRLARRDGERPGPPTTPTSSSAFRRRSRPPSRSAQT